MCVKGVGVGINSIKFRRITAPVMMVDETKQKLSLIWKSIVHIVRIVQPIVIEWIIHVVMN